MQPEPAIVIESESEDALIRTAQAAVSSCDWTIGRCASLWCQRYARGRTDADFAVLLGTEAESIAQRRRVFETFNDVADSYPGLTFSHFRAALSWDDAAECLAWAQDHQATYRQMVAWRRMQHRTTGESLDRDLSIADQCDGADGADRSSAPSADGASMSADSAALSPPAPSPERSRETVDHFGGERIERPTDGPSARDRPPDPTDRATKAVGQAAAAIERVCRVLDSADVKSELDSVSGATRQRLATAIGHLTSLQEELGLWIRV